jgi:hypothetical protein
MNGSWEVMAAAKSKLRLSSIRRSVPRLWTSLPLGIPSTKAGAASGLRVILSRLWWLLFAFFAMASISGHDTGSSYLRLSVTSDMIAGRWEIDLHDVAVIPELATNQIATTSLDELRTRYRAVPGYALNRLKVRADDVAGIIRLTDNEPLVEKALHGTNLVLNFVITNLPHAKILEVDYRLLFDLKPQHRGLLQIECRGETQTAIFSPDHCTARFEIGASNPGREFLAFGWQGVWHIWIGFDHVLFLLALLLPSVLKREENTWQTVTRFRDAFINVFKIVTAFTVAHSVTLSVAALQVVQLPARWVESAIAASVLLAAVNNIRPFFHVSAWFVAFVFGLIHGFGFANVLTELGLPRDILLLALVGFNLGVEFGQLAIVGIFLPVAYKLRASWFYRCILLRCGSVLIALIAGLWFLERAFSLELLPMP